MEERKRDWGFSLELKGVTSLLLRPDQAKEREEERLGVYLVEGLRIGREVLGQGGEKR